MAIHRLTFPTTEANAQSSARMYLTAPSKPLYSLPETITASSPSRPSASRTLA